MVRRAYSPEQIINKLGEAEVLINQGATAAEASRKVGITGLDRSMNGAELDAVTCALVGIIYLRGEHRVIGDPNEMLMILPQ